MSNFAGAQAQRSRYEISKLFQEHRFRLRLRKSGGDFPAARFRFVLQFVYVEEYPFPIDEAGHAYRAVLLDFVELGRFVAHCSYSMNIESPNEKKR